MLGLFSTSYLDLALRLSSNPSNKILKGTHTLSPNYVAS
jgi:hypothetical protein